MIEEVNRASPSCCEQNASMALSVAKRAFLRRDIALQGAASELQNEPRVQAAYLGGEPGGV